MTNAAPTFYLPKDSLTGRMDHNKPAIQMLPMPTNTPWQRELDKVRKLRQKSQLTGKTFMVSRQRGLKRGDLVVWAPTGKPGLWRIIYIHYNLDPGVVDYRTIEQSVAAANQNPCGEIELSTGENCGLKARYMDIPRGKVQLEWEGGWGGYCNDRLPVTVKIEEIRLSNEMEAIALAAL